MKVLIMRRRTAAMGLFGFVVVIAVMSYGLLALISAGEADTIVGKVIVLDPGHGGRDPGASDGETYFEKHVNLEIAKVIRDELAKTGARVILTRHTDVDFYPKPNYWGTRQQKQIELGNRIKIADENNADWFLSIHANAHSQSSKRGPVTFYYYDSKPGRVLAELIQEELNQITEPEFRRQATPDNFFVLRTTTMPALIIEVGFITNPEEYKLLHDPGYRQLIAKAITAGLLAYYGQR